MSGAGGGRPERLGRLIAEAELDVLLVEGAANLRYLAGYTGSNGLLLAHADGGGRFYTDFRYASQVAEEVDGAFECEIVTGELLDAAARSLDRGRVGFDDTRTSVSRRAKLGELAPADVELVAAPGLVERMRAVKDEREIELIAGAATLIDELLGIPGVLPPQGGRGFGRSALRVENRIFALRVENRIFAMLVRGRLVLKLPQPRVDALVAAGHGIRGLRLNVSR